MTFEGDGSLGSSSRYVLPSVCNSSKVRSSWSYRGMQLTTHASAGSCATMWCMRDTRRHARCGGITGRIPTQPRSWRRAISRSALPKRARNRSLSRTERHQRASHSRSQGPINLAMRAHPARNPAAAVERGFTANQRCSSCSTSKPGFGPGEYVTYWPEAASRCCNWRTSSWNSRHLGHCARSSATRTGALGRALSIRSESCARFVVGGSLQGGHQPTGGLAHFGPLSTVHEPAYVVGVMHGDLGESGALVRPELQDQRTRVTDLAQSAHQLQILLPGWRGGRRDRRRL